MARRSCILAGILAALLWTAGGCDDETEPLPPAPPEPTVAVPAAGSDASAAPVKPAANSARPVPPTAPAAGDDGSSSGRNNPPAGNPAGNSADSESPTPMPMPIPPAPLSALDRPAAEVEVETPDDFDPDPNAGHLEDQPIQSADDMRDRIIAAYANLQSYESRITFSIVQKVGRWDQLQRGLVYVAYDRPGRRFLLDKPDIRLVIDDDMLLLKSYKIEGRHLEADAPDGLQYQDIEMEVPHFAMPNMPDVTFLLSAKPIEQVVNYMPHEMFLLPPHEKDALRRPGLMVRNFMGTWTFRVDPKTYLITSAVYAGPRDQTVPDFAVQRWHEFEIEIISINQSPADGTFDIPLADSRAVATLRELIQGNYDLPSDPGAEDKTPGRLGKGNHPLAGAESPPLALRSLAGNDFRLDKAGNEFIVLIFWSSWDGKSEQGLQEMQTLHQWAEDGKKAVKVHAVNVREEEKVVRQFVEATKLTMPVYLDREGKAAEAFDVTGLPQIMVIRSGRVLYGNRGVVPDMAKRLREFIEAEMGVRPREIPPGIPGIE